MKLKGIQRLISGAVSALMIASSIPTVASAADQQTRGNVGGYDYEMWNQNGQGQVSMQPGAGSFTCSWSNIENFLARMGKNYDSQGKNYKDIGNIVLTYDVEYTPRGNSYMCVYGWTKSPLVEYYIVEGWGDWRPPGNDGENKGSVTLNGNTYDIRKSMRYNQPSLEGTSTFPQYWSVRQTSGSANNQTNYMKGTIDVSKHFDAWSQAGLDMSGKLYEVSLNIEGYRSNGSANVKSVTVSTDGSGAGASNTAPANNNNQQQAQNNDWNNGWNWNNQQQNQQPQNNDWNNGWNWNQNNDWNNQQQNQNNDWNNGWNWNQNNDWNNQQQNQQPQQNNNNNTPAASTSQGSGLKDIFAPWFKIGTSVSPHELSSGADFIKKNYNSITPENELKPDSILDQSACQQRGNNVNTQITLSRAAQTLKFCESNGISLRGHTFVWYSQTPDWFFRENFSNNGAYVSKDIMDQRLESMIKNTFAALKSEYPNLDVYAYDVCNELFVNDGGGMRPAGNSGSGGSTWVQIYGDDSFVLNAFKYARKYAPAGCKLYLNDYNEYISAKTNDIYNMAMKIKQQGNIDGIGMQAHLATNYPDAKTFETALNKFLSTGLDVQITELDITCSDLNAQANLYEDIFKIAMANSDRIPALTIWGTSDNVSWRSSQNPLLFSQGYQPKPAYDKVVALAKSGSVPAASNNNNNTQQQNNNQQQNQQPQNNDWNNQWNNQNNNQQQNWNQNNDWNNQWNNQNNNQQQNWNQNNDWSNQDWFTNVSKWGDANNDSTVDMADTVSIMQSLANPDKYNLNQQGAYNGDVFNPGSGITNSDAQSLQMWFLGSIPNLPYGDNNWNNQWNWNNDWNNQNNNQQQNWNQNNQWNNQQQNQQPQNNDWNNGWNWNQNNDWNNQWNNQQQNQQPQNNDWNNQWNQNQQPQQQNNSSNFTASGQKFSVGSGQTQHKGDNVDGYSYEIWLDNTGGSGSMTLGSGGSFSTEWSATVNAGNFLARRGRNYDASKKATQYGPIVMDYAADYSASSQGNSRLCVYGWMKDPLVEYYIIEDWVNWCPSAQGGSKTVTIDGAEYEIFQLDHTGPTILGNTQTFKQYFSVRKSKRTSGTITVSDHFKAWENAGWNIGNLTEVALNVEGWESSGKANVTKLTIGTSGGSNNNTQQNNNQQQNNQWNQQQNNNQQQNQWNWNQQQNNQQPQQQNNTAVQSGKKLCAISFDDGASATSKSDPGYRIIDALIKNNMTATFFNVGNWIKTNDQIKYEYQNGMEVANHTQSHPHLGQMGASQIRSEWEQCNSKLKSIIGADPSKLMRLPYLESNATVQSALNDVPLISCAIDTQDWNGASKDQIVNTIKQAAQNGSLEGAIVLCHENYAATAAAMEEVLPWLAQNGYQNVNISDMAKAHGKTLAGGQVHTRA
ncbi:glycoside hydrolase family 11 protein [Ruminococcus flavefaciens]|uniref:glycoside hydrolase family 11 protein n=1 Tax=Ruminococcus flavefaciens TaxID=1265 RepID=UPI0004672E47|nr:glycoside hydrolase family 11 protein [Ruminococcus flavefaciens]